MNTVDDKRITPEEQRKARLQAQAEANRRAMNDLGRWTPPTVFKVPRPPVYPEPADVIDLVEWKKQRGR